MKDGSMHPEEWREVHPRYHVSNRGRVRTPAGERMPSCNNVGYAQLLWTVDGKPVTKSVHRLVAIHFIGPPPAADSQVNHKNGVKNDNRVENLEWCSSAENARHALSTLGSAATYAKGERHWSAKLREQDVRNIRSSNLSNEALSRLYRVCNTRISQIRTGKAWRHVQ